MTDLLTSDATNALYVTGMVLVLRSSVELNLATNDYESARVTINEAMNLLAKAVAEDSVNVRHLTRLASFRRFHVLASAELGKLEPAQLSALEKGRQDLEALFQENPTNAALIEEWILTSLAFAEVRGAQSPAVALTRITKAAEVSEAQRVAVGNDEGSATYPWRILSAACSKQAGKICEQIGDLAEAQRHWNRTEGLRFP
ncbi:MAG: hypothetical protein ACI8T1_001194 [Verrucomicrobiales bacterium]|jgi:hypothetical protein